MRRWAALATLLIAVAATAPMADRAVASPRTTGVSASSPIGPGTVWVLWTGASCETEAFGPRHTFTATGNDTGRGNGDQGTYTLDTNPSRRISMAWRSGARAGGVYHAPFDRALGLYRGHDTFGGHIEAANLDPASYRSCPVVTATLTTSSTAYSAGDRVTVAVTGAGGLTPTGGIQVWVCPDTAGPCDPNAAGTKDLGAVGLSGSGLTATGSTAFTPTAAGRYCFAYAYGGDAHYGSIFGASDQLCFTVTPVTPHVTAAPAQGQILLGGSNTDQVTVTGSAGVTPTGTVTFYVCGPSASPSSCTATTGAEVGTAVHVEPAVGSPASATAASGAFTPTDNGVYCFVAVYGGDGGYSPASDGSTSDQCFTVLLSATVTATPRTPSILIGAADSATATVVGENAVTPTGSVHVFVCEDDPQVCAPGTLGFADLGTPSLSGSGATASATTAAYTPTTVGWYCFYAAYAGDANYGSFQSVSGGGDCFMVTSEPTSTAIRPPRNRLSRYRDGPRGRGGWT